MLVVTDLANDLLHWYDAEMNELQQHNLPYPSYGVCTQNDMLVVTDVGYNLLHW